MGLGALIFYGIVQSNRKLLLHTMRIYINMEMHNLLINKIDAQLKNNNSDREKVDVEKILNAFDKELSVMRNITIKRK